MDETTPNLHLDHLSNALHQVLQASGGVCILLLDAADGDLSADGLLGSALQSAEVVRVPSPDPRLPDRRMPLLARLDTGTSSGSHLLQLSLQEALEECLLAATPGAEGRRVCGWMHSDHGMPTLARQISRRLLHRTPAGGEALLRWTDPAVLWGLWPLLLSEQRTALLGYAGSMWLLDPGGHLSCIRPEPGTAEPEYRLRLDAGQWSDVANIGSMNQALSRWAAPGRDAPTLESGRAIAMTALRTARRLGFGDSKDLAAFAYYALAVHPDFAAHPWVEERLRRRAADDYFSAVVDDLTSAHWQRIGDELAAARDR